MPQVSQEHQDDQFVRETYELKSHVKDLRPIFFDRLFVVMINAVGSANAASNV